MNDKITCSVVIHNAMRIHGSLLMPINIFIYIILASIGNISQKRSDNLFHMRTQLILIANITPSNSCTKKKKIVVRTIRH